MKKNLFLPFLLFLMSIFSACIHSYDPEFDYQKLLSESDPYDYSEMNPDLPVFSYEKYDSSNLKSLRNQWDLEKKAGNGSEFSQVFNLMKFVNEKLKQNGGAPIPRQLNAGFILNHHQTNEYNCLANAVTLNGVLLSMNFRSRVLTLYGKEISDDCHAVIMVWLESFDKWIYLDPSYQAYLKDEDGAPLSPFEIRQALIDDREIQPNEEINWNDGPPDLDYLNYLSKNLYYLYCPDYSEYDHEENSSFRIHLVPKNTFLLMNPKVKNISTSNPVYFFKNPESEP